MKNKGWLKVLAVTVAFMVIALAGCMRGHESVTLKPGCYITQAYHYYPDGTRCHCMVVAGLMDSKPYLDVHDLRIEDSNGQTCTLVFEIGNSDSLYCVDNYPLSNLNY